MAAQKRKTKTEPVATPAQILTAGTVVRLEQPKSKRKPKVKASEMAVVVAQEINPVSGFMSFLREHAIVGLAIGFVVATQVQTVVKQLIASFIDPLYGLLFNGQKLSSMTFTVEWHGRTQQFAWGQFAYTMIDFLFVLAIIYLIVKFLGLDKWDKPKQEAKK